MIDMCKLMMVIGTLISGLGMVYVGILLAIEAYKTPLWRPPGPPRSLSIPRPQKGDSANDVPPLAAGVARRAQRRKYAVARRIIVPGYNWEYSVSHFLRSWKNNAGEKPDTAAEAVYNSIAARDIDGVCNQVRGCACAAGLCEHATEQCVFAYRFVAGDTEIWVPINRQK